MDTKDSKHEGPQNDRPKRYAARVALLVIAVSIVAALLGISAGVDSGERALAYLGMLILGPVFTWFLVWSVAKTMERAAESGSRADAVRKTGIDTVVFDIGNVLTDYAWEDWLAGASYPPDVTAAIARASFLSPEWNDVDRGERSMEEIVDSFVRNDPGLEQEIRSVFSRSLHGLVSRRERAIPWIRELKAAGYRVYYLSNFSAYVDEACKDALDFIPETDGGILSYEEHLIKPDEAIYRLLAGRFGVTPERAVFIDDRKENVEAAVRLGFRGIIFETQAQAEQDLRAMGVIY